MKKIVVLGSLNMDFVIRVKKMPEIGETILGEDVTLIPGGKGANQAYAVGKLGGNVAMLGAVGTDTYGSCLVNNLKDAGVDINGIQKRKNESTGQAFITVYENGNNSIIVIPGANGVLEPEILHEDMKYIEECDYIIMQLEIPLETVRYIKELALKMGKKVVIDPAPALSGLEDSFWKGITILKPNETELGILIGRSLHNETEMIEAARSLISKGVETVLVTLGERGCLWVQEKAAIHFPAKKTKIVDTTAAGDSFLAALVTALSEDKSFESAIEFAQTVSSIVVSRHGAQPSIPWRSEVPGGVSNQNS